MQAAAPTEWHVEAIPRGERDGRLVQLTSAPIISDMPRPCQAFTPDGRRLVFTRRPAPYGSRELWLADFGSGALQQLTVQDDAVAPAMSPDGRCVYFLNGHSPVELRRVWLDSLKVETVAAARVEGPALDAGSVRGDGGAYVATAYLGDQTWGLLRFELGSGHAHIIEQGPALHTARAQYDPGGERRLLVAESRGALAVHPAVLPVPPLGLGLTARVLDDSGTRDLPVALGGTDLDLLVTNPCWVGTTGRVLGALMHRDAPDRAFGADRIVATTPGEEERVVVGYGHSYAHPSVSRDGRWWVCDEADTGDLYLGSTWTGRAVQLVRTGASWGTPGYTRPRPMLSPDGSRVAYISDATGVPQLYVARVSDEVRAKVEGKAG